MKTAVIRARIPETLKDEFEKAVAIKGWNLSHGIRELMSRYVATEKDIAKKHEETLEALADIESGRIIDGQEVLNWLSSWGSEDELTPPK